jgi:PAS domain S-box-containing protein
MKSGVNDRRDKENDLLRAVIATAVDGILVIDRQGLIKLFNPAAERLFGYNAAEVLDQNVRMLMPEPYHGQHDGYLKSYRETGQKRIIGIGREVQGRRKDGSIFPMELAVGEISQREEWAFVGIIRDITTEKHRSRELAAVIETAVDGIIIIDRLGIIKVFNPAAVKLFGYAADDVIGRNVRVLMPEPYHGEHDTYLKSYRETGRRQIIGIGREVKGQRKDGSTFPMELAVGEVMEGEELAFVGIIRDVTAQKEAFDALTEARARAESANAAKSEFLSRMSHELRTPMNAILGFAQLMRMSDVRTMAPEQVLDYLDSIIGPAEHLTNLIDDILDFSRIEVGGLKVARVEVNLAEAVTAAVVMAQPMASRLGISIFNRSVDRSGAPIVLGDPVRLRQCIVNLLTNAIKYNRPGGRVLIDLTSRSPDEAMARLTVEDTGVGIPEARLGELFRPFTRLHPGLDHVEGAGIGLAVTRQLIEAMGGTVTAESDVGRGSRFHLDIPETNGAAERKAPLKPTSLANWHAPVSDDGKRQIVLYVEDNPANVHLMESLFRSIPGVELRIAYSAELGLEMAAAMPVRAIILDINLPGINGFEALERLRAQSDTADVPVIGLSARATSADIERAAMLGFYRYLTKPVNITELMETLRSVL